MHEFDTKYGKLFYTVLTRNKKKDQKVGEHISVKLQILIIQKHPSSRKIETNNILIARCSLLDLAEVSDNKKECQIIEKKRPITIRPILTNSKYKSTRSLMSSPQRK